jgi:hypothetical protein
MLVASMSNRFESWLVLLLGLAGCGATPVLGEGETSSDTTESGGEPGDGDGDPGDGDGDGDPGDGDPGDGDPGDGDGDGDPLAPSVLLIGNSYTYANDLPGMLAAIADASPTPLNTDSLATAGARVIDHLGNPALAPLLAQAFDVVVIQGQSLEPIVSYPTFQDGVVELAGLTGDARVLLFETWPRKEGNVDLESLDMTVEEMWGYLASGYLDASVASESEVARVGTAWMSALALDAPPIELYTSDGSHPSLAGSYLAACVLFGKIVDRSCSTSSYAPAELTPEVISELQTIADVTNDIIAPGP